MRQFRTLFHVETDEESGIMNIYGEKGTHDYPALMVRREGDYVPLSLSYGPIEIALRLRYADLSRTLDRLQPVSGLQTTRQVGSNSAFLGLGLGEDGSLMLRPTIVADARGHLSVNLRLPDEARQAFMMWIAREP